MSSKKRQKHDTAVDDKKQGEDYRENLSKSESLSLLDRPRKLEAYAAFVHTSPSIPVEYHHETTDDSRKPTEATLNVEHTNPCMCAGRLVL